MAEPRTVVVTGASRGLGFASAVRLYREGWRVVAAMRTPDRGLGTLAPVVDAAAREGDEVARGIVAEAARRLCRTAGVVIGEGARERGTQAERGGGPLVLAGSLLTEPTELAHLVRAELGRRAVLARAGDNAAGAAALAVRAALPGDPRAAEAHRVLIEQGGPWG